MAKLTDKIGVVVTDGGTEGGVRRIEVGVEAPAVLFAVSDLLAQEDAIEPLKQQLKRAVKELLSEYVQSGKELLKRAANANSSQPPLSDKSKPPKENR